MRLYDPPQVTVVAGKDPSWVLAPRNPDCGGWLLRVFTVHDDAVDLTLDLECLVRGVDGPTASYVGIRPESGALLWVPYDAVRVTVSLATPEATKLKLQAWELTTQEAATWQGRDVAQAWDGGTVPPGGSISLDVPQGAESYRVIPYRAVDWAALGTAAIVAEQRRNASVGIAADKFGSESGGWIPIARDTRRVTVSLSPPLTVGLVVVAMFQIRIGLA